MMHTCNLCTGKVEARESEGQGQPWLHGEFHADLGYGETTFEKVTEFY